jgi:ActR/RegA family two-component response regulator
VLRKVKERTSGLPVILMTAFSTLENAVAAMKLGAFHYVNGSKSGACSRRPPAAPCSSTRSAR